MNTTQVRCERRAAQRFDFQLPVSIRVPGRDGEGHGFTQDLSGRGVLFYTDLVLTAGDPIELTLLMPSEITLGESMRVRCRGKVIRAVALSIGGKSAIATHFDGYEYLPTQDAGNSARNGNRGAASQESPQEEAGVTVHTFDWRGVAP
jgi:hypothetical protein